MALDQLHGAWQAVIAAMLVVGGVFALVGAIGMLRFRDFYMRLHAPTKATTLGVVAPTKATTLGVGGVLIASMAANWGQGNYGVHELLITLFLFITAPVSANLLAKAALHLRAKSKAAPPPGHPHP